MADLNFFLIAICAIALWLVATHTTGIAEQSLVPQALATHLYRVRRWVLAYAKWIVLLCLPIAAVLQEGYREATNFYEKEREKFSFRKEFTKDAPAAVLRVGEDEASHLTAIDLRVIHHIYISALKQRYLSIASAILALGYFGYFTIFRSKNAALGFIIFVFLTAILQHKKIKKWMT